MLDEESQVRGVCNREVCVCKKGIEIEVGKDKTTDK
jgi:hypothetical protein